MKEKFYENFWEQWIDWNINRWASFCLMDIYWPYIQDISKIKVTDNNTKDIWQNKEYHENFLIYLEELLKNWELKMAILFKDWRYPREDEYNNVPKVTPRELNFMDTYYKEYDKNNYREWIEDLRKEWNREMTEDQIRLFEDWNVSFSLPENNFFILEWSWEKRN